MTGRGNKTWRDEQRWLDCAQRHLVEAQHALLLPAPAGKAAAVLHCLAAIFDLAKTDTDGKFLNLAVDALKKAA